MFLHVSEIFCVRSKCQAIIKKSTNGGQVGNIVGSNVAFGQVILSRFILSISMLLIEVSSAIAKNVVNDF